MSAQQLYYSRICKKLPEPFKSFDWKFTGFVKQARKLFDADPEEIEDFDLQRVTPDAFYFDQTKNCLIALEIIDTNEISDAKAQRYCDYAFALGETSLLVLVYYPRLNRTQYMQFTNKNDSSVHSTIPLMPAKISEDIVGIPRNMRWDLEEEFNKKWTDSDKGRQ